MKPRVPQTYEEITRRTVVEPDGSFRPSPGETSSMADGELRASVADALLANGLTEVGIEVERGSVILRGWVRDATHMAHALRVVAAAVPDAEVENHMHIGVPD